MTISDSGNGFGPTANAVGDASTSANLSTDGPGESGHGEDAASGLAGKSGRGHSVEIFTLIYAVFVAGLCSIVYELLIATTTAYFMGDSVKWFSLTIGLYMAAMGAGAYISKFVQEKLLPSFIAMEVCLGLLGGLSVPVLYFSFSHTRYFVWYYAFFTLAIGFLIGMEIPFLTRLLQGYKSLRVNIAHVLSLDYFGALLATLAFPLLLLPFFGIFQSGLFFGLVNMTIGLLMLWCFRAALSPVVRRLVVTVSLLTAFGIIGAITFADELIGVWNARVYKSRIVYAEQSRYQQIVLTRYREDLRLYLNGNLQFSALDEYRYHEALVHLPITRRQRVPRRVLLLGGGDGLAVRELLKYPEIEKITLVDLDPSVLRLAKENPNVTALNGHSLTRDPRVRVIAADAFTWLQKAEGLNDLILIDLPDPNNTALARLYSAEFYRLVKANLAPDGIMVSQSTSPYYARDAFWTIQETISSVFAHSAAWHQPVPAFGDWGFVMASRESLPGPEEGYPLKVETRYLSDDGIPVLFHFPKDTGKPEGLRVSTLDRPIILELYQKAWQYWGH